ncbi:MAG: hypothetical protein U5L75_00435 [Candidatus Campbellbacteria bacterium]|nr:hypothetical protein [Candidatus Campbellbacteria bacterium]
MKIKQPVVASTALFIVILLSGLMVSLYIQPDSEAAGLIEERKEGDVVDIENSEDEDFYFYDRAFDIGINSKESFEDLVIGFEDIGTQNCEGGRSCQSAEISLRHTDGSLKIATMTEGDVINAFGYRLKLSQIAPEENSGDIERRVVVVIESGKNEGD